MAGRGSILSVLSAGLLVGTVAAQDRSIAEVVLVSRIRCPSSAEVESALRAQGIRVSPSSSRTLELRADGRRGVHFELRADGQVVRRPLRSRDCAAIAEVSAFIARRHFEALHIPMDEPAAADESEPSAAETAAPAETAALAEQPGPRSAATTQESSGALSPPLDSSADARLAGSAQEPRDIERHGSAPSAVEALDEHDETRDASGPLRALVGLGPTALVSLGPSGATVAGEAYLGLSARRWMVRLVAGAAASRGVNEAPSVRLLPVDLRVDAGAYASLSARWALLGLACFAVTAQRVSAPDEVGTPVVWRATPKVGAVLGVHRWLNASLGVGLEVATLAALRVDRYRIEPLGEVARSPRGELRVALGFFARIP